MEEELNKIFIDNFEITAISIALGRKELEERLIQKYRPVYNLWEGEKTIQNQARETSNFVGTGKAYSVEEIRKNYKNAYIPWSKEDDDQLGRLESEGKSIAELASIFGRNAGAISSRLKKLQERKGISPL